MLKALQHARMSRDQSEFRRCLRRSAAVARRLARSRPRRPRRRRCGAVAFPQPGHVRPDGTGNSRWAARPPAAGPPPDARRVPRAAGVDRCVVEGDRLPAGGERPARPGIDRNAAIPDEHGTHPLGDRIEVDQTRAGIISAGEQSRNHARIARVAIGGEQDDPGIRRSAPCPCVQRAAMRVTAADQQDCWPPVAHHPQLRGMKGQVNRSRAAKLTLVSAETKRAPAAFQPMPMRGCPKRRARRREVSRPPCRPRGVFLPQQGCSRVHATQSTASGRGYRKGHRHGLCRDRLWSRTQSALGDRARPFGRDMVRPQSQGPDAGQLVDGPGQGSRIRLRTRRVAAQ